jgi:hypothetical protein
MKIGVVSDTHGLFRPEIKRALKGVERILHLGDVGDFSVLKELGKIAPVTAKARRASCRRPKWCSSRTATFICCTI